LTCETCQKTKAFIHGHKAPISQLPSDTQLFRVWFSDIHGMFMPTKRTGMKYIIVFVEKTSLWTEFKAIPDCSAAQVIQAFMECVISRFGVPESLILFSDNGSAYTSQLTSLFCKTFAVTQYFTAAYRPQSDEPAEILGGLINRSLRLLAIEQENWDESLPMIAYSYRSMITSGRNLSPYEIIHGRPMKLEIDWKLLNHSDSIPDEFASQIQPKLRALQLVAAENARANADRQRARINKDAVPPSFKVGQKVLLYDPTTKTHEFSKLKIITRQRGSASQCGKGHSCFLWETPNFDHL
jgi:hypothetical protein